MDLFAEIGSLVRGLASNPSQKTPTEQDRPSSFGRTPHRAQQGRTQQAHRTQGQAQANHQRPHSTSSTHHSHSVPQAADTSGQPQVRAHRTTSSSGVDALVSMGFPRESALRAWHRSGGDMVRAVEAAIAPSSPPQDAQRRPASDQASPPLPLAHHDPPTRVESSPPHASLRAAEESEGLAIRVPFDERPGSRDVRDAFNTTAGPTTISDSGTSSSRPISSSTASPPSSTRAHLDPSPLSLAAEAPDSLATLSAADYWGPTATRPHSWHFAVGQPATERDLMDLDPREDRLSPPLSLPAIAPIVSAAAPKAGTNPGWEASEAPRIVTPQKMELRARRDQQQQHSQPLATASAAPCPSASCFLEPDTTLSSPAPKQCPHSEAPSLPHSSPQRPPTGHGG
eukprot:CAMPEP_0172006762 /NCGR_PEP_ID=MMETSP1041-20130122/5730_1 /TAXON_ID=464988 /ORGANISM="Hemiselmis andersenii, Strain CCMP439" /LENGTH=397 /DNA_ID=CAMNT_0012660799 /DNA_START=132 /DNA_END=1322 /DNA_ORIENTATION=+